MIELTTFLFFKLIGVFFLVLLWAWPLCVVFIAWAIIDDEYSSNRVPYYTWMGALTVVSLLALPTYYGHIWPTGVKPANPIVHPSDGLLSYTLQGFNEWKKQKAIDNAPPVVSVELGTVVRRYRLNGWIPPKHYYVDITDVETGENFPNLYVSKHCNNYTDNKRGDEYNIELRKYSLSSNPSIVLYEFTNLYRIFCD